MMQVLVFLTPLTRLIPSMQRLSVFMSEAMISAIASYVPVTS